MFNTFRQTSTGSSFEILESTATPLHKRRQGKLAHIACLNCRARKLKCTGDLSGCARCKTKHLDCTYPANIKSPEARRKASTVSKSGDAPSPKSNDSDGSELSTPSLSPGASDMDLTGALNIPSDLDLADTLDLSYIADNDLMPNFFDPSGDGSEKGDTIPFPFSPINFSDFSAGADWHMDNVESCSATQQDSSCTCLEDAARAYQSVEVTLCWTSCAVWTTLRNQKDALENCSRLLACTSCSARPEFVMLVISMGYKVLRSMCDMVPAAMADGASSSGPLIWGEDDMEAGRRQQLDDEDRLQVLKGLLSLRMKKQAELISRLESVVFAKEWPAHKSIVWEMRERCVKSMDQLPN